MPHGTLMWNALRRAADSGGYAGGERCRERFWFVDERLIEQRTSGTEFGENLDLVCAAPATGGLADAELECRARNVWAKFEHAPVRSFVPVLVEREILRAVDEEPDTEGN